MKPRLVLAFCAAMSAAMASTAVVAQSEAPPTLGAPAAKSSAKRPVKAPRKRDTAKTSAPAAPASAYQLVPGGGSSAQTRARQGSFGTPDDDTALSGPKGGRMGIGMGGSNGTTPGMQMGF